MGDVDSAALKYQNCAVWELTWKLFYNFLSLYTAVVFVNLLLSLQTSTATHRLATAPCNCVKDILECVTPSLLYLHDHAQPHTLGVTL